MSLRAHSHAQRDQRLPCYTSLTQFEKGYEDDNRFKLLNSSLALGLALQPARHKASMPISCGIV